ncbi:hypothetical protein QJS10_CPB04g01853 [Acorus calamus]|uniref:RRM domain-containing protein n=1 Tax=Acorus calamus TaxID=4465 RepID=A0AAV9EZV4_ACOCL|nr:hypothetical protein QJS10_CPB04g01853 [Acorus calamus]
MSMSRYGRVKNLRLVRHIVTGASRGYAFIEYETEKEMRRAYEVTESESDSSLKHFFEEEALGVRRNRVNFGLEDEKGHSEHPYHYCLSFDETLLLCRSYAIDTVLVVGETSFEWQTLHSII